MRVRRGFALVLMGLLAGPLVPAQQVPTKPLGDVAREQRDARKLRCKKDPQKTCSNEGGASPRLDAETGSTAIKSVTVGDSEAPETNAPGPQTAATDKTVPKANAQAATPDNPTPKATETAKPVVDRQDDTNGRSLVIPAGTQIKVDVSSPPYGPFPPEEGTLIVSVYAGFSMAIPARSKVRLSSAPPADGTYSPDRSAYVWVAVTAVTFNGATYKLHTNALPLSQSRAISELTFTLSKPLTIP